MMIIFLADKKAIPELLVGETCLTKVNGSDQSTNLQKYI